MSAVWASVVVTTYSCITASLHIIFIALAGLTQIVFHAGSLRDMGFIVASVFPISTCGSRIAAGVSIIICLVLHRLRALCSLAQIFTSRKFSLDDVSGWAGFFGTHFSPIAAFVQVLIPTHTQSFFAQQFKGIIL
jgi:hypothetical protein